MAKEGITIRINNIETSYILSIPYDKPDLNNVIYTKDAILQAYQNVNNLPIMYKDDIIGVIKEANVLSDDIENKILKIEIKGLMLFGGTCCQVQIVDDKVTSFDISAFGIST